MFKSFTVIAMLMAFVSNAHAAPVRRLYQDVKLPTQQVVEKQTITAPAADSTTNVVSGHAGATSAAIATVTSGLTNPDVPRNLVITPGGTTTDVESCVIVVAGTNIFNQSISENFTFAANDSAAQTGTKAFKTITSVTFPANCESGGFAATWSIGAGSKLGLNRCMAVKSDFLQAGLGGTREGTFPTVVASATAVESNTVDLNSAYDDSADVQAYFMQNFRCFP
jgi:hypothetical protein